MKPSILVTISLVLGIVFAGICGAQDPVYTPEYKQVYMNTYGNGRPMFVYVGAEWCQPCKEFKAGALARFKAGPHFSRFNYIELDIDRDREIVKQIGGIAKVPHMIFVNPYGETTVISGKKDDRALLSIIRDHATFYGKPVVLP